MANFQPFNYGTAVAQGQRNALRQADMQTEAARIEQRNVLADLSSYGLEGADMTQALRKRGQPALARKMQAENVQQKAAELRLMSDSSRKVFDADSFTAWKQEMEQTGIAKPGEMDTFLGAEYDAKTVQKKLRQLRGQVRGDIKKLEIDIGADKKKTLLQQDGQRLESYESTRFAPSTGAGGGAGDFKPATLNKFKDDQATKALKKIPNYSPTDEAKVAWTHQFERYFRQSGDSAFSERMATADIERNLQSEQGMLWGSNREYDPTAAARPIGIDEKGEPAPAELEEYNMLMEMKARGEL